MSRIPDQTSRDGSDAEALFRTVFYIALLVYLLVHLVVLRGYRWDDKLFPYLVGIPLIALLLIQLAIVTDFGPYRRFVDRLPLFGGSNVEGGPHDTVGLRSELVILAWTISLPIYIYFVGFVYALPTYIFVFIVYYTRDPWRAFVTAALFMVFGYFLFIEFLSIRIYDGVLGLPDLIGLF